MVNPYWGTNFFQFFATLGQRIFALLKGESLTLASDEVQILVLAGVAVSCGLIGSFLAFRKMTMVANSLSHTLLLGIVLATLFLSGEGAQLSLASLLTSAFLTALITVGLSRLLSRSRFIKEDAGIGLSFTTLFALGLVALMLFAKSTHIGIEAVMGNLDAVHKDDIFLSWSVAVADTLLLLLFYPWLKTLSFDTTFAFSLRLPCKWLDMLFLFLVSATCVSAFRAVGVLLVLAFLTGPTLCAKLFFHRIYKILFASIGIGLALAFVSVAIARHMLSVHHTPLSTAGIASVLIGLVFGFLLILKRARC